jgi:hypothetical protein
LPGTRQATYEALLRRFRLVSRIEISRVSRAEAADMNDHGMLVLLLSANLERAVDDREIAKFLEENQAEVESIFAEALRRAQGAGELSGEQNRGR